MIKATINNLEKAGKKVLVQIGFDSSGCDWTTIFDPKNQDEFHSITIDPLVNFISEFKIYGIIINCLDLYDVSKIG